MSTPSPSVPAPPPSTAPPASPVSPVTPEVSTSSGTVDSGVSIGMFSKSSTTEKSSSPSAVSPETPALGSKVLSGGCSVVGIGSGSPAPPSSQAINSSFKASFNSGLVSAS